MIASQTWDCPPWQQPIESANPDERPTDWRAVCGRTARTVRREGRTVSFYTLSTTTLSYQCGDLNQRLNSHPAGTISAAARSMPMSVSRVACRFSVNTINAAALYSAKVQRRISPRMQGVFLRRAGLAWHPGSVKLEIDSGCNWALRTRPTSAMPTRCWREGERRYLAKLFVTFS